jgi:protein O-mannosyl-transferase
MGSKRTKSRPRSALNAPPSGRGGGSDLLAATALLLLVVAAFWPAFSAGFVYDDPTFILQNPRLTEPGGLGRIWLHGIPDEHYWPVTYSVLWVERALWGVEPGGYHAVNILLHAANTVMLWLILRRVGLAAAWLAAAVFGLHPVHVESVAWALELKDVLSGLWVLAAFRAYLRFLDTRRYVWLALTTLLFAAGMLSKSAVLPFPAALLIYHWWKARRWTMAELAPIALLAVIGGAIAAADVIAFQALIPEHFAFSVLDRTLIASRAIWFYLAKLAWPVDLSPMYARWDVRAAAGWASLAGLVATASAFVVSRRVPRGLVAAAAFFVVMLGPTLGFLDFSWMKYAFVADRFQYLASIGPIAAIAAGITWLAGKYVDSAAIRRAAAALLLVALGALTQQQAALYANEETFYRGIVARNPSAWAAHMNLGVALMASDRAAEAVPHHVQALALKPDLVEARVNLGAARAALGQVDEAAADFVEAIRLKPSDPAIHDFLGIMRARQDRLAEAIDQYEQAIRLDAEYASAHNNLAIALAAQGRLQEAVGHYQQYVRLSPDDPLGHENLARALRSLGQTREASAHEQIAAGLRARAKR